MRFVSQELISQHTNQKAEVYLPVDPEEPLIRGDGIASHITTVSIDGVGHPLSYPVIEMLSRFSQDPAERAELGHDCAVFALACSLGDDLGGIRFDNTDDRAHKTGIGSKEFRFNMMDNSFLDEPLVAPRGVICSMDATPTDPGFDSKPVLGHMMVKASVVFGGQNLYASKFGSRGPVALHTYGEALNYWPAKATAVVKKLVYIKPQQ